MILSGHAPAQTPFIAPRNLRHRTPHPWCPRIGDVRRCCRSRTPTGLGTRSLTLCRRPQKRALTRSLRDLTRFAKWARVERVCSAPALGILATPSNILSPRIVRVIEELTGDWRRLDERIERLTSEIEGSPVAYTQHAATRKTTVATSNHWNVLLLVPGHSGSRATAPPFRRMLKPIPWFYGLHLDLLVVLRVQRVTCAPLRAVVPPRSTTTLFPAALSILDLTRTA